MSGMEAPLEGLAIDRAAARGWFYRKLSWIGRRNAPDRFFAKNGRVVLVEFKSPGEKPRPGQVKEIAALRAAGLDVRVIDNLRDAYALFDEE